MSAIWTLTGDTLLSCKQWGDEYIIYHEQSGDTHLLNETSMRVLNYLRANTAGTDEIFRYLNESGGIEIDADQLDELIANLTRLGLVEVRA